MSTLSKLIDHLSATSQKVFKFNILDRYSMRLSALSLTDNQQGAKKPNDFNACRLSELVSLRGMSGHRQAHTPEGRCGPSANCK
jgi:hypothetical protein